MEAIVFTHPGLNLSRNVSESIFVALPLSQFCFRYGTFTSDLISTYRNLPWQVSHSHKWYTLRRKMNMSLMWRGSGGKGSCLRCQRDSAASVIYLTNSLAWLRSDGLIWHKRHRLYLKCLEKLQEQVPHTCARKKFHINVCPWTVSEIPLFDLNPLDFQLWRHLKTLVYSAPTEKDTPSELFIRVKPFTTDPEPLKRCNNPWSDVSMCVLIQVKDIFRICCELGINEQ